MDSTALPNHKASPKTLLGICFFCFILFMIPSPKSLGLSKEEGKAKIQLDTYLENEGFPAE